jgi:branched-chain amino acid aminotransferase
MSSWAYFNGQLLPREQVSLPLDDLGFLWGATVTDRVRTFEGCPFLLNEHLIRFRRSAYLARIPLLISDEELVQVTQELITRNRTSNDLSVVFIATPGDGSHPTLLVYTLPINQGYLHHLQQQGVQLQTTSIVSSMNPAIKHRSRLNWWIAREDIHRFNPQADPLFQDEQGHVLETTTANLLAVFDGVVTGPPRNRILNGISLDFVEKLCSLTGIPVVEREIGLDELQAASEVMVTNSTLCIAWVSRLNEYLWRQPGSLFQQLTGEWEKAVGTSIHGATTLVD